MSNKLKKKHTHKLRSFEAMTKYILFLFVTYLFVDRTNFYAVVKQQQSKRVRITHALRALPNSYVSVDLYFIGTYVD